MRYIRVISEHLELKNPRGMYIVTKMGFNACLKIVRPIALLPTEQENTIIDVENAIGTSPRFRLFEMCQDAGITCFGYDWDGPNLYLFTADDKTFMTFCLLFDEYTEIPIKYDGEVFDQKNGLGGAIDQVFVNAEKGAKRAWKAFENRKCVST